MKSNDFAYCGLNCTSCQQKFTNIRLKLTELDDTFSKVNIASVVKQIPFMKGNYKGYRKLSNFFMHECLGCRQGGGNPYCSIRKCAIKKGYSSCVECETDMCKRYKGILEVHDDNELQNNRHLIS